MNKVYTVQIEEDENGEMVLPLPDIITAQLGWKVGDVIDWKINEEGVLTLTKEQKTELVMVEAISTFHHRFLVEVPAGEHDIALDTVEQDEAAEFSQKHLGETTFSYHVMSKEEVCKAFREDNVYLTAWSDAKILESITNQPGVSK